ncbi:MAG: nucleotidyltransferase domain-containing protein [Defluviitaleaceae bacterium]|nr:nucleotidyltransferase domain-containing protein [Defluviitaleaceae bacterium]
MDAIKNSVAGIAEKYGVARVYLFGSYARGVADENSDIDLRIDKDRLRGLFQLSGFQQDIIERLGKRVDVLTTQSLDDDFLQTIRKEEILLYEN